MKVIITPQKALELLTDYALKRRVDHSDKYIIKAYSNTIKEAISKETPMKPYKDGKKYKCSRCKLQRVSSRYCRDCGQKVDWSDIE
jgi:hypothetical protein